MRSELNQPLVELKRREANIAKSARVHGTIDCVNPHLVTIGARTILSYGAVCLTHGPKGPRPCVIGKECFIGRSAIILPGVTIGDRVLVGAGAVVTKDVPSSKIVAGNPANVIGDRDPEELKRTLADLKAGRQIGEKRI